MTDWAETFREIYDRAVLRYRRGARQGKGFCLASEKEFLAGIGCSEQEFFDWVEDACDCSEPPFGEVLLIQAERRDYLLSVQGGQLLGGIRPVESFPAKSDQLGGIAWLPRLIAKARAKLRGELPPELMYG